MNRMAETPTPTTDAKPAAPATTTRRALLWDHGKGKIFATVEVPNDNPPDVIICRAHVFHYDDTRGEWVLAKVLVLEPVQR